MALTPQDILNHVFTKKGSKGYLAQEVDQFLDQVNEDYTNLLQEVSELRAEKDRMQVKISEFEAKEHAVNQAIVVAQESANRLKADADAKIKQNLTEAQATATKLVADARMKAEAEAISLANDNQNMINEQNTLRHQVDNFKQAYLQLLQDQKQALESDQLGLATQLLPAGEVTQKHATLAGLAIQPETPAIEQPAPVAEPIEAQTTSVNVEPTVSEEQPSSMASVHVEPTQAASSEASDEPIAQTVVVFPTDN